jgi:hypothetical protein
MKTLHFLCRGQWYKVTEKGYIIIMGVSKHHWRQGIDIGLKEAFKTPESLIDGLVWDIDHGTVRQWGGSFNGKLPRIVRAYVSNA